MYLVYILKSEKNGKYYIGSTDNIERRLKEHNSGRSKYTKPGVPWRLAYKEEYNSLSDAKTRELQIKSWRKRVAIERLIKVNEGPIV